MTQEEALQILRTLPGWDDKSKTIQITGSDGKQYIIRSWHLNGVQPLDEPIAAYFCWHVSHENYPSNINYVQQLALYKWIKYDAKTLKREAITVDRNGFRHYGGKFFNE